jgi:hypothetical protein
MSIIRAEKSGGVKMLKAAIVMVATAISRL